MLARVEDAIILSTLKISEDMKNDIPVSELWMCHEAPNVSNNVIEIRSCICKVQKLADYMIVLILVKVWSVGRIGERCVER